MERAPGDDTTPIASRFRNWQIVMIALMVVGYSGYYLCRSNFSVSLPSIIEELAAGGMDKDAAKERLGAVASWGTLAYAIGKFLGGGAGDFLGGRRNFLTGMAGSVFCTVGFALGGGLPIFTLAWIGNRAVQSIGWVGMVKITARWFSFASYGTAMGVISLSYLFGDAASRWFMGLLMDGGVGWRGVFFVCAGVLFTLLVANLFFLKETPKQIGLPEPLSNPANLFGARGEQAAPTGLGDLLRTLLGSPAFWLVCALSLGLTLVRETFNTWTPTYYTEVAGLSKEEAAGKSALFPFFGGVSVLLAGFWSDRIGQKGRATIILGGLILTTTALLALGSLRVNGGTAQAALLPVVLVTLVGFLLIGPYSYLGGAIALDFGGKQGSATAAGIIDGVGYLGGILAGKKIAEISIQFGWQGAFFVLAGVVALCCVAAAQFLRQQRVAR
jgi:OPA family glycerol-3-phosphate transporter-like MFS transporter